MTGPGRGLPRKPDGDQTSAMRAVRLRRLNRWQAEDLREDLADLYVESSHAVSGEEYHGREAFLRQLEEDVRRPGFDMLLAERKTLAGCVFGFPVTRDGTWWQGFLGALPRNVEQLTASGHLFAISHLVVHPHDQGRDLADRLQRQLLADHEASLGVTLVEQSDGASLAAFRSWGWREIGEVRRQSGSTALRALVLPLGERTAEPPDGLGHNPETQRPE